MSFSNSATSRFASFTPQSSKGTDSCGEICHKRLPLSLRSEGVEEPDLREVMRAQADDLGAQIAANALANAAYTYQSFSDDDLAAYADALEHPKMQQVYTLMNAVQYEIMANRFEAVAARLAAIQPSQDI